MWLYFCSYMWYSFDDNGWKVVIVNLVNNNMKFLIEFCVYKVIKYM